MFNDVREVSTFRTLVSRRIRPTLDALGNVLDAHGEVKLIQDMAGWACARRFAQGTWSHGAVAQDRHWRLRRHPETLQHAAQLLALLVRLGGHAAEHDLLTNVIANVSDKHLERATLIAVCRSDMAAINRDCHILCWWRRRRAFCRRQRFSLEPGSDVKCSLSDRLHFGHTVTEWEKLSQKPACTTIGHPCTQFGYDALIPSGATFRHDLRNRRERAPRRNAATAGLEPRRAHFDSPEQRVQPPSPDVLQRALLLATRTAAALTTVIRHFCLDEVALYGCQEWFGVRQCQAQWLDDRAGALIATGGDLAGVDGAIASRQFRSPPATASPSLRPACLWPRPTTPKFWTVSAVRCRLLRRARERDCGSCRSRAPLCDLRGAPCGPLWCSPWHGPLPNPSREGRGLS
jgi:hypothetical protein